MTSAEALNAPTEQPLEVVDDDGVVTSTLNRPRSCNDISMQLAELLREAAQHLRMVGTARVFTLS
jgi:enoyl-CoA hydratase/carnithine racemase